MLVSWTKLHSGGWEKVGESKDHHMWSRKPGSKRALNCYQEVVFWERGNIDSMCFLKLSFIESLSSLGAELSPVQSSHLLLTPVYLWNLILGTLSLCRHCCSTRGEMWQCLVLCPLQLWIRCCCLHFTEGEAEPRGWTPVGPPPAVPDGLSVPQGLVRRVRTVSCRWRCPGLDVGRLQIVPPVF